MKMSGGPTSLNIKLTLLVLALAIAFGTVFYTQSLVKKLQSREKQIVELFASSLKYVANPDVEDTEITFIFENMIQRIDFPLILTDKDNNVTIVETGNIRGVKNLELDTTMSIEQLRIFLSEKIIELGEINPPIEVVHREKLLTKIYYGDSDIVKRLRYYPYLQILFAILFIIIAYISFSYLKRTEQSNIWVGMSKETAHQLGTPISSLLGWTEMLKINSEDSDKVLDTAEEIASDLKRLNKITQRFSKIGSKPELQNGNVYETISSVIDYFERRLPQTRKNVTLLLSGEKNSESALNAELFEWVIENLIKNALDAIGNNSGKISIDVKSFTESVEIEVSDSGKGIDIKRRKDIFRPGYSTKRRGWGLGLSLSKRIIEEYHKGKIFVKHSVIGEGTTFQIILKKEKQ